MGRRAQCLRVYPSPDVTAPAPPYFVFGDDLDGRHDPIFEPTLVDYTLAALIGVVLFFVLFAAFLYDLVLPETRRG
jgi:hypothetical protein